MESILRSAGHEVVALSDGDALEEKVTSERPDGCSSTPSRAPTTIWAGRSPPTSSSAWYADLSTEVPNPASPDPLPGALPAGRACVVLLGGRPFAVDVTDVREVVVVDATTPVPGAPASVVGVMNLRGRVLPVVEARPLLGLPARVRSDRALVLADGERQAAVVVEGVVGLTEPDALEAGIETGRVPRLDARAVLAAIRRPWDPARGG